MRDFPGIVHDASPNYRAGNKRKITCVILHATATSGIVSPLEWLTSPQSKVSAHYLIGKDGKIYQLVDDEDIAWHAGISYWRGKENVNTFSVGIELVNANDGKDSYPQAQIDACLGLCVAICKDYGIRAADVIGHKDIAPGRKTDPAGFPWDEFRGRLFDEGV